MFSDPTDLFHAAQTAIAQEDWRGVTELCDSTSLRLFRLQTLQSLQPRPDPTITVEDYLKHAPDMPRSVAEYHVSLIGRHTEPEARLKEDFPTVGSIAELARLSPVELFTEWLKGTSPRAQVEKALRDHQIPRKQAERIERDMREQPPFAPPVLLGVVPDGDQVAHVLYRDANVGAPDPSIVEEDLRAFQHDVLQRKLVRVETVRRSESGAWGLIAAWGMLGLGINAVYIEPTGDDAESD